MKVFSYWFKVMVVPLSKFLKKIIELYTRNGRMLWYKIKLNEVVRKVVGVRSLWIFHFSCFHWTQCKNALTGIKACQEWFWNDVPQNYVCTQGNGGERCFGLFMPVCQLLLDYSPGGIFLLPPVTWLFLISFGNRYWLRCLCLPPALLCSLPSIVRNCIRIKNLKIKENN